jgi:hypothetical protein
LIMDAAVDLLPTWAMRMHGLSAPHLVTPLLRLSMSFVARTLRWAFAGEGGSGARRI